MFCPATLINIYSQLPVFFVHWYFNIYSSSYMRPYNSETTFKEKTHKLKLFIIWLFNLSMWHVSR